MNVRRLAVILTALAACLALPVSAFADAPAWRLTSLATPTEFVAGDSSGGDTYEIRAGNVGAAETSGSPVTIADTLPKGLALAGPPSLIVRSQPASGFPQAKDIGPTACTPATAAEVTTVTCVVPTTVAGSVEDPARLANGEELRLTLPVAVPPAAAEGEALRNRATVEGGGAPAVSAEGENQVATLDSEGRPEGAPAGFAYYDTRATDAAGQPVSAAAGHPFQLTTEYALNTDPGNSATVPIVFAGGDPKDVGLHLPAGFVGSATAVPACTRQQFNTFRVQFGANISSCPDASAVGFVSLRNIEGTSYNFAYPIFNLVPPPGIAAQFGFLVASAPFYIDSTVRNGSDYGVTSTLHDQSQAKRVSAAAVTIWGDPADPRHDALRGSCLAGEPDFRVPNGKCDAEGIAPRYLLRLPTSCQGPLDLSLQVSHWPTPSLIETAHSTPLNPTGCAGLHFEPTLKARPTTNVADQPSGLDAELRIPQEEDPEGVGTADLRKTVVDLPEGLVINPSGARGLDACTPEQIGLQSAVGVSPPQFTPEPSDCPPAARIGTVEVTTPLLGHPLKGGVYVATPHQNPFGNLFAIYIAVNDEVSGVNLKLAGEVKPDPQTGRLTTVFDETPQQPFSDFQLHFYGGPYAALRTPQTCGPDETDSSLTPWSAPFSGPPVQSVDSYAITQAPGGGACATSVQALPNAPEFEAGSQAPIAGTYSPFTVRLSRPDGSQEFSSITVAPPPGLLARLAGVPYCSDAALQAAREKSGHAEQAQSSCPAASQVGTVVAGAGAGPSPYYTSGKVYLAGPYKGAPLSLATITPAVAGPYDLGDVVVRVALEVDPLTARVTAVADPLPRILEGVPLDVRQITLSLDRPQFSLNPTDCDPLGIEGSESSVLGAAAPLSGHFQVGECGALKFKPSLKLQLKGATKHAGHPALRAVLTYPKQGAYANIARAQVNLPHSEFIDQGNLNKTCTRPVLLEGKCTAKSIYGRAKAWTPLLEKPLEGPVYLVGGFGYKLPALVAELNGQIRVLLVGKVDSGPNKGIRNTFEAVPDAPVEKFELRMKGGPKYSLLENSEDLCKKPQKAIARFTAQNGNVLQWKPKIAISCGKKKHKKAGHHKAHGHGHGHGGRR